MELAGTVSLLEPGKADHHNEWVAAFTEGQYNLRLVARFFVDFEGGERAIAVPAGKTRQAPAVTTTAMRALITYRARIPHPPGSSTLRLWWQSGKRGPLSRERDR